MTRTTLPTLEFITDEHIYEKVIQGRIPLAESFVWIATSDLKDLYVHANNRRMMPFLEVLSRLIKTGVSIRLLHAKEPGPAFRKDFDRYPNLVDGMERLLCPRVHFKSVVVDGSFAYAGSANLTGAGMGAKSQGKRNFEHGFITTNPVIIKPIMAQFDEVWMGTHCPGCRRKEYCAEARDMMTGEAG